MKTVSQSVKAGRPRTVHVDEARKNMIGAGRNRVQIPITPPGGLRLGIANGYTCGYGNRSLRVAARSLKVDNGPWRDRRRGPFGPDQKGRCPRFDAARRAIDRGENYCLKIRFTGIFPFTAEMMMKTLTASSRAVSPVRSQ